MFNSRHAEFEADGSPDQSTIKPMVDGGTEGFKGHARVILPGITPCFQVRARFSQVFSMPPAPRLVLAPRAPSHPLRVRAPQCTMWLFPPQTKFPLCTLAETPRTAAHCIEYAHLIAWGAEHGAEVFDADDPAHMGWVHRVAVARADQFGIPGVTLSHTQGVVKNIIPAIPSTNAIVAAACALETIKIATLCSAGMNNTVMFNGTRGVYTHTVAYDRDPGCAVCGSGVPVAMPPNSTLQSLLDALLLRFPDRLAAPSISHGVRPLYVRGVFEEETRPNLSRTIEDLLAEGGVDSAAGGCTFLVNDRKMTGTLRIQFSIA